MSDTAIRRMDLDEFLPWQELQEWRCELVDGRPVAMTGATFGHERVAGNIMFALKRQFRAAGNPCDAFGPDIGLVVNQWTLRRPDVAVYCPPFDDSAVTADQPRLVADVLSRSTDRLDQAVKAEEYKLLPSVRTVLLVNPLSVEIGVWRRESGAGWSLRIESDLDARIDVPDLDVTLACHDIYERATLVSAARPRLVWPDKAL